MGKFSPPIPSFTSHIHGSRATVVLVSQQCLLPLLLQAIVQKGSSTSPHLLNHFSQLNLLNLIQPMLPDLCYFWTSGARGPQPSPLLSRHKQSASRFVPVTCCMPVITASTVVSSVTKKTHDNLGKVCV